MKEGGREEEDTKMQSRSSSLYPIELCTFEFCRSSVKYQVLIYNSKIMSNQPTPHRLQDKIQIPQAGNQGPQQSGPESL